MTIYPVILCGGSGSRLWPVSRSHFPKQLLPLTAERTMLQETAQRVRNGRFAAPIIVTGEDHRFHVIDQLAAIGITPAAILLEPEPRDTAPAIALAAEHLLKSDSRAIMLAMPSDHAILDTDNFLRAVDTALAAAADGYIVTFGIQPVRAETGYGYIEASEQLARHGGVHAVAAFVEKPDLRAANAFLAGGRHWWNSGTFLFSARVFLDELASHDPAVSASCHTAMSAAPRDGLCARPDRDQFHQAPSISIDHALMERSRRMAMVPVSMGWSDIGSWDAVWEMSVKDEDGNCTRGNVLAIDDRDSLFHSENGPMIAALGVSDLVVVSVRDAVLILPRGRAQEVRKIVDALHERHNPSTEEPPTVHRPWGTYETMDHGPRFQTKHIVVNPGQELSLQMHHHRTEHWIVVSGTASVTIDDKVFLLQENQSACIPAGSRHRLENPGKIPLHLIEIQCGPYLGEDDIVRFEDIYGRAG